MHLSEERKFVLPYCGQSISLRAKYLHSSDLVQTEARFVTLKTGAKKEKQRVKRLPAGWLWRRNRQMGHDTGHKSEWLRYPCLYSLWMAGLHINTQQPIEHEQIARLIEGARQYANYLVYLHKIRPQDLELFVNEFSKTIQELSTKRAPRKVVARTRFTESAAGSRGKYLTDSSGKRNPMATAMQVGGGIGHLQERERDVIRMGANLDARTLGVFLLIQDRMKAYWDLWYAISTEGDYWAGERLGINLSRPPLRILAFINHCAVRDARAALETHMAVFSGILERPFCNNAARTHKDLSDAKDLLQHGHERQAEALLLKVQNGIRWIFACHFWWMFVLAPLSMLMDDLLLAQRALRCQTGEKGPIIISKKMAVEEFEHIETALAEFERRLEKCSDEMLEHPLRPRIQKALRFIHTKIQQDDWRAVKKLASGMARIF